jgi:hypothetical protein
MLVIDELDGTTVERAGALVRWCAGALVRW